MHCEEFYSLMETKPLDEMVRRSGEMANHLADCERCQRQMRLSVERTDKELTPQMKTVARFVLMHLLLK